MFGFQFRDQMYIQITGTPMGSPISVVIAELTMQYFENSLIENSHHQLLFWKRYVDDILTCLDKNEIENFFNYINSRNNNFSFKKELEIEKEISFLDLKIMRAPDNNLRFSIYRKETHTGLYLNYHSNNTLSHKKSVAYSLFQRAKNICSPEEKEKEDKLIIKQLKENGYPYKIIKKCFKHINETVPASNTQSTEDKKYIKMPYIKGASEKVSRILKPFNILIGTKSTNNLRSTLSHVKDRVDDLNKNSVIYKIPCNDCS